MDNSSIAGQTAPMLKEIRWNLLRDAQEFDCFPNRASYDAVHKLVLHSSELDLLAMYKSINMKLVTGEFPNPVYESILGPLLTPLMHPASGVEGAAKIRALRQLMGFGTRLEGNVDPSEALSGFRLRVSQARNKVPEGIAKRARDCLRSILGPVPTLSELVPKHGPGAVATGERGAQKAYFSRMYRQLLPLGGVDLLHYNEHHWAEQPYVLSLEEHPITKVVCVPKDISKPRIISCEPLEMQFLQQGLARYMMAVLEHRTDFHVNFRDQETNRQRSKTRSLATLDLSNASDTVSRGIVRLLLPRDWSNLLFALRSHFARMPDGAIVPLRAFAPMGSALCFVVESAIFYSVVHATLREAGLSASATKKWVYVYGDDIIVPVEYAQTVVDHLRGFGFEPNSGKCCFRTAFRESCGAEWWDGIDISITRPRSLTYRGSLELPMVASANELYKNGFNRTAEFLARECPYTMAIGHGAAYGHPDLPWKVLGAVRWNRKLFRLEQRASIPRGYVDTTAIIDDYPGLFMAETNRWRSSGLPSSQFFRIEKGWLPL